MAGQSRIVGKIDQITHSTGQPDTDAEFIIQYYVTGAVTGQLSGEVVLTADVTQSENQISLQLRSALAAYLDPLVFPLQNYVTGDVRGCNV